MLIPRFGKWAIVGLVVTTAIVITLDFYDSPPIPDDSNSPLSVGAAHLDPIQRSDNAFENEDWSQSHTELALLNENSTEPGSIDLMLDEQSERTRPNVLPELGSVPAVPLLSPQQRKANTDAIRKVHPHATDEQLEFWLEETRGLPPEMIQEMLRLRDQIGPLTEGFELNRPPSNSRAIPRENAMLRALTEAREIVLENLANSETIGYLRTEVHFVESSSDSGRRNPKIGERVLDTAPGRILETNEPLDIVCSDSRYLQVVENEREYVTRFGHLKIGPDRRLMLAIDGSEIVVSPQMATVPVGEEIQISTQGEVFSRTDATTDWTTLGRLSIVNIANPKYLTPTGNSLYQTTERSGKAIPVESAELADAVRTGALELSNVQWDREQQRLKRLDWLIEQYER